MLYPFILAELTGHYSFEQSLEYGLLPVVFGSGNPKDTLEAYVDLYIIRKEHLLRDGVICQPVDIFLKELTNYSNL